MTTLTGPPGDAVPEPTTALTAKQFVVLAVGAGAAAAGFVFGLLWASVSNGGF